MDNRAMTTRRNIIKSILCVAGIATVNGSFASEQIMYRKAMFWTNEGPDIRCLLCPRGCLLKSGATGLCRVRKNNHGILITLGYSNPCAIHVDPIEKKPLFHVLPGAKAFSVAVAGCTLKCKNCQNYTISQASPLETDNTYLPPQKVVDEAMRNGCRTIAFTYSEPVAWYEYMYDTAKLAKKAGLKNLLISSGYINRKPLEELAPFIDAANIDLKSFSDEIYRKLNAGALQPILDAILLMKKMGVWLELGNLVVPQWTDDMPMIRSLCQWICAKVGPETPMHFLRFYPLYLLAHLYPTPTDTLLSAQKIARETGLKYVYVGNVAGVDINTCCAKCGKIVLKRDGYLVTDNNIKNSACSFCGNIIPGVWS
jgi:pyruvate formate lyase activating enzyme